MFGKPAHLGAKVVRVADPIRREGDDDLLTAGLGLEGLRQLELPAKASVRQRMIHRDVRGLMDVTEAGGFARLHGPRDPSALHTPGVEARAYLRLPGRADPFEVLVLMPDRMDRSRPCLIVSPSSGSRGVTGAIGDLGMWALTNGCALVLTDKGAGVGAHLLSEDVVYGFGGEPVARGEDDALFARPLDRDDRALLEDHPHAVALKHAHSGANVEADWPHFVLAAARFGLDTLTRHLGDASTRPLVIAAGVSNGGGSVLRAAEIDKAGLLDGVVAVEPQISPPPGRFAMRMGDQTITGVSRPLYDVASQMALLTPVAALNPEFADHPLSEMTALARGAFEAFSDAMAAAGQIAGEGAGDRARGALAQMRAFGFEADTDACVHAMAALQIWPAVTVTFANGLGRFRAADALNGVTFAFADPGDVARPPTPHERAFLAGQCGGLAPSGGLEIIGPSGRAGLDFAAAEAFRALWTGKSKEAKRVREGVKAVLAKGRLDDRPIAIVHGQSDSLVGVNHTSRPYMAKAVGRHGAANTRYYEIAHGQHFETLLMLPRFAAHYSPLAPYVETALARVREAVETGRPLPPSQRVDTRPRVAGPDGALAPLAAGDLDPIREEPDAARRLSW